MPLKNSAHLIILPKVLSGARIVKKTERKSCLDFLKFHKMVDMIMISITATYEINDHVKKMCLLKCGLSVA